MNRTFVLTLSSARQLVDINEDHTNFSAHIHVESKTNAPFRALIINGEQLHKVSGNAELPFQRAAGSIDINIQNDNDVKTTWYLWLESNEDNIVNVAIDLAQVPAKPRESAVVEDSQDAAAAEDDPPEKGKTNWVLIIAIIVLVLIAGYFIYRFATGGETKSPEKEYAPPPLTYADDGSNDFLERINQLPDV